MRRGRLHQLAGHVGGKTVIDLNVRWRKGQTLEPDWKIEQDGWVIQIDGQPTVTTKVGFLPPPYFQAETIADFMVIGHIMTAMPTDQCDSGRRRRGTRHRHLRRPAVDASPRRGAHELIEARAGEAPNHR